MHGGTEVCFLLAPNPVVRWSVNTLRTGEADLRF